MINKLIRVTILVRDYEEALRFYGDQLGFEKRADFAFGQGMRWVTVAPPDQRELEIVLQVPVAAFHGEKHAEEMLAQVGQQPTWVFETDDCQAEYGALSERGVAFTQAPKQEPYGTEALFQDPYGNTYSLLQPTPMPAFGSMEDMAQD